MELILGQDLSIGYERHSEKKVTLYNHGVLDGPHPGSGGRDPLHPPVELEAKRLSQLAEQKGSDQWAFFRF